MYTENNFVKFNVLYNREPEILCFKTNSVIE